MRMSWLMAFLLDTLQLTKSCIQQYGGHEIHIQAGTLMLLLQCKDQTLLSLPDTLTHVHMLWRLMQGHT